MITKKDSKWMSLAKKMQRLSNHPKYKMVCLIVKSSRLISVGVNKDSAPKHFVKKYRDGMHLHAEISSILGVDKDTTRGCTAYISGETKSGKNMLAKPCPSCYDCLMVMGIKRIVYLTREGEINEHM